jgi:hypothetical protein
MFRLSRILRPLVVALASLLMVPGCGGDDPTGPGLPPEPPPTEVVRSSVGLPADWSGNLAALQIVNSHGAAACGQDGEFELECFTDGRQLVAVTGPAGEPMLLSWFGSPHPVIDVRTTAEVLLWFSLGTWMLPPESAQRVRDLIAELETELDPVEAALAEALVGHPSGLPADNPALQAALADLTRLLLGQGAPGDKGIVIAPEHMQSGVEILNEGGINKITVKNSYRRRSIAFIHQKAWIDADQVEHAVTPPVAMGEFEIPPVDGFGGSINTILGFFMGGLAYEPKILDPIALPALPDARRTIYDIDVLGFGLEPAADLSQYTSEELARGDWMALKCLVLDYFFPLLTTMASEIGAAGHFDDAFGGEGMADAMNSYLTFITTGIPAFHAALSNNDWWGATLVLVTEAWTSEQFQEATLDMVGQALTSAGMAADRIVGITTAVESFFKAVGLADVIGSLVDSIITGVHFGECERANTWDVSVTAPVIHLEPREAELEVYQAQLVTCVLDDDTGGPPTGAAYAYRWRCAGTTGTLVNPIDPDDLGNDFMTSVDGVQYVADAGVTGQEIIACDLYIKVGADTTFVQRASAPLSVWKRTVVLPDSVSFCPGGVQHFTASLAPAYGGDVTVAWSWQADGTAGTLSGPHGQVGAWSHDSEPTADYEGFPTGGTDRILCIASRQIDGGYSPIDTAVVHVRVGQQEMYHGVLGGEATYDAANNYGFWRVWVRFPKVAGADRYQVYGHEFHDWAYYGDSFTIVGPGWPPYSHETETEVFVCLTYGGGNTGGPPDDLLAWGLSRFAGGVFEVTPDCH